MSLCVTPSPSVSTPSALLGAAVERHRQGRVAEAGALYARVLALEPAQRDALHLLGMVRGAAGEHAAAARLMWRAWLCGCAPAAGSLVTALVNLGATERRAGAAIPGLRAALALAPAQAEAWNGLATWLRRDGAAALATALTAARRALRVAPEHGQALQNAGAACRELRQLPDAIAAFGHALALNPSGAELWNEYGVTLFMLRRPEAEMAYRRALRCRADLLEAAANLAALLQERREPDLAASWSRRVLALAPAHPAGLEGFGALLREVGQIDAALTLLERGLVAEPGRLASLCNLSVAWSDIGCVQRARDILDEAERLHPDHPAIARLRLGAANLDPDLDEARRFALHRRFGEIHGRPLAVRHQPFINNPDPERRIRIGYVSSDLCDHSVARNLGPLVAGRDRTRSAVHFYSDGRRPDAVTQCFRELADGWCDVAGLSDAEIAERVRADGIDILVILAGRFDDNRPLVAACRAAPVQISFHDVATSGLDDMDYLIADPVLAPRGTPECFSERVLRLPSFYLHDPLPGSPDCGAPPCLRTGSLTFASFNSPSKINDRVLALWGRILSAVDGSRLLLRYFGRYGSQRLRRRILGGLAAQGVAATRVDFLDSALPTGQHLSLYRDVDIALDTFPFCGSTTSFEALWMGVPVLTLPGDAMVSRWTASILTSIGLTEFIAGSPEEAVAIARRWSGAPERLAALRAELRGRILASPIVDGAGKARHLEHLYRAVWRRWCRSVRPAPPVPALPVPTAAALLGAAVERHRQGRAAEAGALYARVLALEPAQRDALHLLGMVRGAAGEHAAAARLMWCAWLCGCAPAAGSLVTALVNLGATERRAGAAIPGLRAALALAPAQAEAWNGLATWLRRGGAATLATALTAARRALRVAPEHGQALQNIGLAMEVLGRRSDGLAASGRVLALDPAAADAWCALGRMRSDSAQADAAFRRALRCRPDLPDAAAGVALLAKERGAPEIAHALLRQALVGDPAHAASLNGLGVLLRDGGILDPAAVFFARALVIEPDRLDALLNASLLAKDAGDIGGSLALLRKAEVLYPDSEIVGRLFLWAAVCDPDMGEAERGAIHRRFAGRHGRPLTVHHRPFVNTPDPHRRIRIGYLSSDLRSHPVSRNLEPVIAGRDRTHSAVHFYYTGRVADAMTRRLRELADGWCDVAGLSDAEIAERVRADGIDILVILAGRFDDNRPLVAACRAAPVQISFHDVATSGLDDMDYLIADPVLAPRGTPECFSERVLRLPSFYLHDPLPGSPDCGVPPCLRTGSLTFASFNNPAKLNDRVLALWGRLMASLPGSRLILKYNNWYGSAGLRRRVLDAFAAHGIAAERIEILPDSLSQQEHLALYRRVDLALDPFPFCGSTTSFEALWMGVPVLTLPGDAMVSRWTASILTSIGLTEFIAGSPEEAVAIARRWSGAPERLAALRAELRGRILASPIVDGAGKARHLEHLYRAVWRRWCRSVRPAPPVPALPVPTAAALLGAAVERHRQGRAAEAGALYARVLALEPAQRDALHLLGMVRGAAGEHAAAARLMLRALLCGCAPAAGSLVTALVNLGATPGRQVPPERAAMALRAAAVLEPGGAEGWNNLGSILRRCKAHDEAFRVLGHALRLKPEHQQAHWNLGLLAMELGDVTVGTAALRTAVRLAPGGGAPGLVAHRHLLWAVLCDPCLSEEERFAEHRRFAERHARPLAVHHRPFANDPEPERRLKVGYVSSDLCSHSVARNLEPLIAGRDRERVAVHFYADCPEPDVVTGRFRDLADGWRDIVGKSDAEVAELVRADGIDVLVVLAGRFDGNRPLVAACRAAPVQVSLYDGATSGLDAMDCILTDAVMTPRHGAERFTERPVRLPTLYTYTPIRDAPDPGPPPCVRNGYPTFASFNNPAKLNDHVLALWGRLLAGLPGSRIILRYMDWYGSAWLRRRVLDAFAASGVATDRIVFVDATLAQEEHLGLYRDVDVALDPFPFGGATTSFEALWLGVPVVTLPQANMMSRWTASLLTAVGLPDLIAGTPDDYLAIAAGLVRDPARLTWLRREVGGRLAASPVCDARLKARHLERALRAMWRRWCRAARTAEAGLAENRLVPYQGSTPRPEAGPGPSCGATG